MSNINAKVIVIPSKNSESQYTIKSHKYLKYDLKILNHNTRIKG